MRDTKSGENVCLMDARKRYIATLGRDSQTCMKTKETAHTHYTVKASKMCRSLYYIATICLLYFNEVSLSLPVLLAGLP